MANPFYSPGEERALKVRELFGAIASRYDLLNDIQSLGLHRAWKRRLVRLADPRPGQRALDVCSGTGDIAFGLARAGAQVVGLDFTEAMIERARQKNSRFGLQNLSFVRGDAQQLPFPDNSFEIVTIGYGLRNLADWEAGLREMIRVTRPGGRLLILDFGKPDNAVARAIYFAYLKVFVPMFGRIFCGNADAYAYIFESLKNYPAQHGVADKLRQLDVAGVRVYNFLLGVTSIHYAEKKGALRS